jgi:hypothetical protein
LHAKTYRHREQAALEIIERMECFHDHRLRLRSALGSMGPCEYEEAYASQPLAA